MFENHPEALVRIVQVGIITFFFWIEIEYVSANFGDKDRELPRRFDIILKTLPIPYPHYLNVNIFTFRQGGVTREGTNPVPGGGLFFFSQRPKIQLVPGYQIWGWVGIFFRATKFQISTGYQFFVLLKVITYRNSRHYLQFPVILIIQGGEIWYHAK